MTPNSFILYLKKQKGTQNLCICRLSADLPVKPSSCNRPLHRWWLVISCSLHVAGPRRACPWSPATAPSVSANQGIHDHSSGQWRSSLQLDAHQLSAGHTAPHGKSSNRCLNMSRGDQAKLATILWLQPTKMGWALLYPLWVLSRHIKYAQAIHDTFASKDVQCNN